MAAWSTEGGAWRGAVTSLLFTFAVLNANPNPNPNRSPHPHPNPKPNPSPHPDQVLNAARGKWAAYPADREALEAV